MRFGLTIAKVAGILLTLVIGCVKTVLIVDTDVAFAFWLGTTLDAAGYLAWPAKTPIDAELRVQQLALQVDVLVINPAIAGASEFVSSLRRSQKDIRVIVAVDDPLQGANLPAVNATHPKPIDPGDAGKSDRLQGIEQGL